MNRIDKLRQQLRRAFYVCDEVSTTRLTAQYTELSAELYYLRHFIDTTPFTSSNSKSNVKNDDVFKRPSFRTQFIQKMLKQHLSLDYALSLFNRFETKYAPEIEVYKNCSDPNLGILKLKLKELGNTFNTVKKLGQRFAYTTARTAKKSQQRIDANPGLLTVFSSSSASDFFKRALDFRVNGSNITEPNAYDQLIEGVAQNLNQNLPGSNPVGNKIGAVAKTPTSTLSSMAQDVLSSQARDADSNLEAIYYTELNIKYRQVSGVGLEQDYRLLNNLESIIKGTFPDLADLKTCTASIINKQCGG